MKRILFTTAAALLVSALPALAQTTTEGGATVEGGTSGSTVIQPGSGTTTGEASGAASGSATTTSGTTDTTVTGSIELSAEQQTELRGVLSEGATPVQGDFDVSVGVTLPGTVAVRPLPPRFVEIVPQYEGYRYFVLADGRIVIVQPDTLEIVYIMS